MRILAKMMRLRDHLEHVAAVARKGCIRCAPAVSSRSFSAAISWAGQKIAMCRPNSPSNGETSKPSTWMMRICWPPPVASQTVSTGELRDPHRGSSRAFVREILPYVQRRASAV